MLIVDGCSKITTINCCDMYSCEMCDATFDLRVYDISVAGQIVDICVGCHSLYGCGMWIAAVKCWTQCLGAFV